jgi:hypothetical protein
VGCVELRGQLGEECLKDEDCLSGVCAATRCAAAPTYLDATSTVADAAGGAEASIEAGGGQDGSGDDSSAMPDAVGPDGAQPDAAEPVDATSDVTVVDAGSDAAADADGLDARLDSGEAG